MVIDSSALVAILLDEPEAVALTKAVSQDPARLNLGDCCSYALAKHTGEPLLFKGKDFSQTDLTRVSYGM